MRRGLPDVSSLNAIPNAGDQHRCGVLDAYGNPCPMMTHTPACKKHTPSDAPEPKPVAPSRLIRADSPLRNATHLTDDEWTALESFTS